MFKRIMLLVAVGTMMAAMAVTASPAFAIGGSGLHCDEFGNCTGGGGGLDDYDPNILYGGGGGGTSSYDEATGDYTLTGGGGHGGPNKDSIKGGQGGSCDINVLDGSIDCVGSPGYPFG